MAVKMDRDSRMTCASQHKPLSFNAAGNYCKIMVNNISDKLFLSILTAISPGGPGLAGTRMSPL